jgi:uncharacterized membrane protein YbhN (UPF0104 family)
MSVVKPGLLPSASPRLRRVLRFALALGLLVLVLRMVGSAQVMERLRDVHLGWIAVALVLLALQTVLSALRWRLTASRLGHDLGLWRALREYFLAQTVNLALPGGVVGDAGRALRASVDAGLERAGQAVVFDRLAGQAALVLVTVLGVIAVLLFPGSVSVPQSVGLALLAVCAAVAFCGAIIAFAGDRWPLIATWCRAAGHAVFARDVWPWQLGLSLATVAANLLAFAACAAAVGVWLSPLAIMVILPLVLFTMLLPLTIGGWGLREGAAVALFPLAGATGADGFAASACFGVVFMLSACSGLVLFLGPKRG